jgi:hypothetical protein
MPAHKLIGTAAVVIALGLAIMATVLIVKQTYPLGIKGNRLDVVVQDCSELGWPYGCDWQPHSAAPEPRKHPRPGRRDKHLRCRDFGNC